MTKALLFLASAGLYLSLPAARAATVPPPQPVGAVPSKQQLRWHALEFYGFVHFGMNTFTDREWGYGDESPSLFNPKQLNAAQWVQAAKGAGMKGLILTAKHHDGFCLWPSKYTKHSVKYSPWRHGKGDVVGALSRACKIGGLKFGVYLSPWDRNRADYGRPSYVTYYRNQMRELLTHYGNIFEVWMDGANGGNGYYGGARETRIIDRKTFYGWDKTWALIRKLQPNAIRFSDGGPDARWVGNEGGIGYDPNWATLTRAGMYPGVADQQKLHHGEIGGKNWLPAECDVSIRPGWFWHPDQHPKSLAQLLHIYFDSVGRGCNLLLNIPPDNRGLIPDEDVRRLRELGDYLRATFATDFARGKPVKASNVRGDSKDFSASRLTDGNRRTYWASDDGVRHADLTVDLGQPTTFDVVRIQEYIPLGQRIEQFDVLARVNGEWKTVAKGQTVGPRRILRFKPVTADAVRVRILEALACPTLSTLEVYKTPTQTN